MGDINSTKEERGKVYGDYKGGTELRADIMKLIRRRFKKVHGKEMDLNYLVSIFDTVNKLSRIAVTPDHIDSWHDISVYANLTEEMLKEIQDAHKQ